MRGERTGLISFPVYISSEQISDIFYFYGQCSCKGKWPGTTIASPLDKTDKVTPFMPFKLITVSLYCLFLYLYTSIEKELSLTKVYEYKVI
jgi:hypothetical protein